MKISTLFIYVIVLIFPFYSTAQLCTGSFGAPIVKIDFGAGTNPGQPINTIVPGGSTTYNYQSNATGNPTANVIIDGSYSIINNVPANGAWFMGSGDHTGNPNGYMAFFNAAPDPGEFYRQTITNLCPGTTYEFAIWVANVLNPNVLAGSILPNITFRIIDPNTQQIIGSLNTGNIPTANSMIWRPYGFSFTMPADLSGATLVLANNNIGGSAEPGNDLAIDDITFRPCGPRTTASFSGNTIITDLSTSDCNNVDLYGSVLSGLNNPSFQWQISNDNGNNFVDIPNATSSHYILANMSSGNYQLRLLSAEAGNITSATCRYNSDTLQLTINCPTSISCNSWLSTPSLPSYVDIGDLDITGDKITVEALINRTQPYSSGTGNNNEGDIVSKHLDPSNVNYLLRPSNAYITTTNGFFGTPGICEFLLNKTYHVAMTYDGAALKFYRNGFLMSQIAATGNLYQNDFPTRIGLYTGNIIENFLGYINEVRIWNTVRTQNDIQTYMNIPLSNPTTQPGLLGYYNFDNLLNKQGNTSFNGSLNGNASINSTNTNCVLLIDSCEIIIPVKLSSFTAYAQNNKKIILQWHTEEEVNIERYVVERSLNGLNEYIVVGTVNSIRNGHNHDYTFTDNSAIPNINYHYRLAIIDLDGSKKYSMIRTAKIGKNGFYVNTYPNPTNNGIIYLQLSGINETANISVTNNMGQILLRKKINAANNTHTTIDVSVQPAGTYWINIQTASNKIIQKIIRL